MTKSSNAFASQGLGSGREEERGKGKSGEGESRSKDEEGMARGPGGKAVSHVVQALPGWHSHPHTFWLLQRLPNALPFPSRRSRFCPLFPLVSPSPPSSSSRPVQSDHTVRPAFVQTQQWASLGLGSVS